MCIRDRSYDYNMKNMTEIILYSKHDKQTFLALLTALLNRYANRLPNHSCSSVTSLLVAFIGKWSSDYSKLIVKETSTRIIGKNKRLDPQPCHVRFSDTV